ncbi:hypothetical protein [Humibacter albus]|uniref:hypothetical protein n=1 Tax=Humibacter albus TaxID=427754 RepID=UPI0003B319D5|nr:hypothetical protein [Humibacter albus]
MTGSIPDRVNLAARAASEAGLDVWYSPFPCELEPDALHDHLVDSARRAEQLRKATKDAEVVFVAGCEVSLFNRGFLAGDDLSSRLETLKNLADSGDPATFGALLGNLNASLGATVAAVRAEFAGRISYASGPWEFIDWAPFDIIGVDAYRTAENASHFREELRSLRVHGKPIAATEFGCCTYRGAAAAGGEGWLVLDESGDHSRVRRGTVRDEEEQAQYFTEVLEAFEQEELDSAFWFTYAGWELPHRPQEEERDLDVASYGAQAVLEDGTLSPKKVFHAIATAYGARAAG